MEGGIPESLGFSTESNSSDINININNSKSEENQTSDFSTSFQTDNLELSTENVAASLSVSPLNKGIKSKHFVS